MTFGNYIKDKIMFFIFQASCMIGSFFYLRICGVKDNQLILFCIGWTVILFAFLLIEFYRRKNFFDTVEHELKELEKPYLISEVMPKSFRLEDKVYRSILKTSNKSVIDAIHHMENRQMEYKEFIENWIHQVKIPITAMYLICSNGKDETAEKIKSQLVSLEHDVETALYYARSEQVYQDYMIREIDLKETILEALSKNRTYLIKNQVSVEVDCPKLSVCCDDKWLIFLMSQILINSANYKKEDSCQIQIYAVREEHQVLLTIEDNGIGIKKEELKRIFDKGFTGSNGRIKRKSTGIGLYLCKKLCRKLRIVIKAESIEGEYTKIHLLIPAENNYFGREENSNSNLTKV